MGRGRGAFGVAKREEGEDVSETLKSHIYTQSDILGQDGLFKIRVGLTIITEAGFLRGSSQKIALFFEVGRLLQGPYLLIDFRSLCKLILRGGYL